MDVGNPLSLNEGLKTTEKPGLFQPGGPGGPGRPKGLKGLTRVVEILREQGVHPARELIKLAESCADKRMKKDIWLALLTYCEAPQREPAPVVPDTPQQSVENAAALAAELKRLSEPLSPNA